MPLTLRTALRKALRARLLLLPSLPTVLWQGERTTVPDELHLTEELFVAPESSQPITVGPTPYQRIRARYVVTVNAPFPALGTSKGTPSSTVATPLRVAESWADTIAAHFPLSLTLTSEGREFRIDRCSTGEARTERGHHATCAVSVSLSSEFTTPA